MYLLFWKLSSFIGLNKRFKTGNSCCVVLAIHILCSHVLPAITRIRCDDTLSWQQRNYIFVLFYLNATMHQVYCTENLYRRSGQAHGKPASMNILIASPLFLCCLIWVVAFLWSWVRYLNLVLFLCSERWLSY